jgi:glycerate 2-kinase
VLSAGSDGIDGNSRAAGAVVDEYTLSEANAVEPVAALSDEDLRIKAQSALHHFYSSTFLEKYGAVIVTGPTGNNLRDLRLLLSEHPSQSKDTAHQIPTAG